MDKRVLAACSVFLGLACAGTPELVAPRRAQPPVRMIAEWEPAIGAMVAWPLSVPDALVVEIAEDHLLFVLATAEQAEVARTHLTGLGIDPAHLRLLEGPQTSLWPRDWGPAQVFDGSGRFGLVDAIFQGYPRFGAEMQEEPEDGWPTFFPGDPGDDSAPARVAAALDAPLYDFPFVLTGGNFLLDGRGGAFCTRAQVQENESLGLADEAALRRAVWSELGIDRLQVLDNTEDFGIQHIDCWLKVLDEETLLVKRPPEGHPEGARIERDLQAIAALRTSWGRPWRVLRIDCPEIPSRWRGADEPPLAAYTNSLILDRKVLVPLFAIPGDEAALSTWREAMPGYEVLGFPSDDWRSFDAMHCRVRSVFDPQMLRMSHPRLPTTLPASPEGFPLLVEIDDRSEAGLVSDGLAVFFRRAGTAEWTRLPLLPLAAADLYTATLPPLPPGTRIEYWIRAEDGSGRVEALPRSAPQGVYACDVVAPAS